MRTWGRVPVDGYGARLGIDFILGESPLGGSKPFRWVEVPTDENGFNDAVWLTTLIQTLKLNLGESPFFANYGIPAKISVLQQIPPDFYVARTQQQFAQYFSNLQITADNTAAEPTYFVSVIFENGTAQLVEVAT